MIEADIEQARAHLTSAPEGAPEGIDHLKMYELGLNNMIGINATVGCAAWDLAPVDKRVAIGVTAAAQIFDHQEMAYLLSVAIDRLTTLALSGHPAYRHDGETIPEPKSQP